MEEKNVNKTIPVFFAMDNNFVPYVSVALKSLIDNANKNYKYNIHLVIDKDVTDFNKEQLKTFTTDYAQIIFNDMGNLLDFMQDSEATKLRGDIFTLSTFYRIFFPRMFPEYDKGLYIDSDTCIPGDISELYNIDLGDYYIGACHEKSTFGMPAVRDYFTNAVGVDEKEYINAGVLLMDFKKLREAKFEERFLELFNKYHFASPDPDQAYINAMLKGKIMLLDQKWNTMPNENIPLVENPSIVHYNLFYKPWHYQVDYDEYFWKYAKQTPFYNFLTNKLKSITEEHKKADVLALKNMIQVCADILKMPNTFRRRFEEGAEIRL